MSASGVNSATAASEKLRCNTLDELFHVLKMLADGTEAQLLVMYPCLSVLGCSNFLRPSWNCLKLILTQPSGVCPWRQACWRKLVAYAFAGLRPVAGHRQYGGVVFLKDGVFFEARHLAMPFGSVASVHNWDREGAWTLCLLAPCCGSVCSLSGCMLCTFARRLLHIPCLRYVDDFFGPDWAGSDASAKDCLAR